MAGALKNGGWVVVFTFFSHETRETMSNTAAPPVTLNQDNIPDDFICSICMTVPVEPLVTPCDHVFCKPCIRQALNDRNLCPIDRRPEAMHGWSAQAARRAFISCMERYTGQV
eukprot:scaffold2293_cov81-Skeletonema_dohrnii-CCMP3373.AAC.6